MGVERHVGRGARAPGWATARATAVASTWLSMEGMRAGKAGWTAVAAQLWHSLRSMSRLTLVRLGVVAALGIAVISAVPAEEQAAAVQVRQIYSTTTTADGQPIRLPQGDVRVGASEYTIPPGARLPVHKHPHTRLAYVLEGHLSVTDVEAGKTYHYKPGDLIVEVVDRWHMGENTGATPVRLLVIDEAPDGAATTVLQK